MDIFDQAAKLGTGGQNVVLTTPALTKAAPVPSNSGDIFDQAANLHAQQTQSVESPGLWDTVTGAVSGAAHTAVQAAEDAYHHPIDTTGDLFAGAGAQILDAGYRGGRLVLDGPSGWRHPIDDLKQAPSEAAKQFVVGPDSAAGHVGAFGEGVGEFAAGGELLDALKSTKYLKLLAENPAIAKVVNNGVAKLIGRVGEQGVLGGAQSTVHGEGVASGVEGGLVGGAIGEGVVNPVLSGVGKLIGKGGEEAAEQGVKSTDQMSKSELRDKALKSEWVDLPNRTAFDEAQATDPAPYVAQSDVHGLKALNDNFGDKVGGELLKAKADALKAAGLDAYHEKGDEFLIRGDSPEELQQGLEHARKILRSQEFTVVDNAGITHRLSGADFSYGIGEDVDEANEQLRAAKDARKKAGAAARGDLGQFRRSGGESSAPDQAGDVQAGTGGGTAPAPAGASHTEVTPGAPSDDEYAAAMRSLHDEVGQSIREAHPEWNSVYDSNLARLYMSYGDRMPLADRMAEAERLTDEHFGVQPGSEDVPQRPQASTPDNSQPEQQTDITIEDEDGRQQRAGVARAFNVPLSLGQRTGNKFALGLENLLRQMPIGRGAADKLAQRQQAAIETAGRRLGNSLGTGMHLSEPVEFADALSSAVKDTRDAITGHFGGAISSIDQSLPTGFKVAYTKTQQVAKELLQQLARPDSIVSGLKESADKERVVELLKRLAGNSNPDADAAAFGAARPTANGPAPMQKAFLQAKDDKIDLGQWGWESPRVNKTLSGALKRLNGALSGDITDSLRGVDPKLAEKYAKANMMYSDMQRAAKRGFVKGLLQDQAGTVADAILSPKTGAKNIEALQQLLQHDTLLGPESSGKGLKLVRQAVYEKLWQDSLERVGDKDVLNTGKFVRRLTKITRNPVVGTAIFSPAGLAEEGDISFAKIQAFGDLLSRVTAPVPKASEQTYGAIKVGVGLAGGGALLHGGIGSVFSLGPTALAIALPSGATIKIASKVLFEPGVLDKTTQLMKSYVSATQRFPGAKAATMWAQANKKTIAQLSAAVVAQNRSKQQK